MRAMADVAAAHLGEIAALDSLDTGVPLWMMRRDLATGIRRMRMFADWSLRLTGETIPATPTHLTYTERVPFGVVGRIIAYNHPAMFGISKVAAPLVAGNTVVLKPSEQTPLSMLCLGRLWADMIPVGVLSVLAGATAEPGVRLVRDPRVRRIAFTGSPQTGREIQRTAAEVAVKHVSLELGGKNALLVLDDADLDEVADGAVKGMNFAFAGQSCGSTSRVLVPSPLLEPLVGRLAARFAQLRLGDPFDSDVQVSPLISSAHLGRVGRQVGNAVAATARLVVGGSRPEHLAVVC
ncbi:MAG: aldehyde dehydrogenase family protein [Streptosporangiaceae bacterium]